MAKRMTKRLVALSSAAVIVVYGIGYAATEQAAVSMAAGLPPDGGILPPASTTVAGMATSSPASQPPTPNSTSLKDGTYSGTGWSRRGSVSVSVTIKNGRIVSAPITGITTHYSQSPIAGLPGQVVARQNSQVDLVSGATDSSMAYQQAVAQALSQAGASDPGAQTISPTTSSGQGPSGQSGSMVEPGGNVRITGPGGLPYSGRIERRSHESHQHFDD